MGTLASLLLSPQKCQGVPFSPICQIHYFRSGPSSGHPISSATKGPRAERRDEAHEVPHEDDAPLRHLHPGRLPGGSNKTITIIMIMMIRLLLLLLLTIITTTTTTTTTSDNNNNNNNTRAVVIMTSKTVIMIMNIMMIMIIIIMN